MLLHVMKYPHCAVNGVFLAERRRNKDSGAGTVHIIDCIPLFHLSLGLTPMLEVALMQVDQHCKSEGLVIAGYYQANENFRSNSPDYIAHRVAEKVNENFSDSCLVMIDNQKLSLDCDDVAFQLYQFHENKWKIKNKSSVHLQQGMEALGVAAALLRSKVYRQLVDFDNHLDDISLDWSNKILNDEIQTHL